MHQQDGKQEATHAARFMFYISTWQRLLGKCSYKMSGKLLSWIRNRL